MLKSRITKFSVRNGFEIFHFKQSILEKAKWPQYLFKGKNSFIYDKTLHDRIFLLQFFNPKCPMTQLKLTFVYTAFFLLFYHFNGKRDAIKNSGKNAELIYMFQLLSERKIISVFPVSDKRAWCVRLLITFFDFSFFS